MGKPEGHISKIYIRGRSCLSHQGGVSGSIVTSHVLLSLKYHKGVSSVGLFLLVGLFVRVGISDDTDLCPS